MGGIMESRVLSGLEVVYKPLEVLKPNPNNARTHGKRQIKMIAESIKTFGFTNPVLVDRDNNIVAGHGRTEASKILRMIEVPTICLENLAPEQLRAYVIADNRLAEQAGWDNSILAIELQNLLALDLDFDVTITGFEVPEIDLILQQAEAKPDADDSFETPSGPAVSCPSDMWLLGKHRIYCGNSLDEQSYQKLMGGRKADAVFVDPPYNVAIHGHVSGNGSIHHREFEMASGEMTEKEFVDFLSASFGLLVRHSKPGSVHFACMDWRHTGEILAAGNQAYDALLTQCLPRPFTPKLCTMACRSSIFWTSRATNCPTSSTTNISERPGLRRFINSPARSASLAGVMSALFLTAFTHESAIG
jgi:hypothetical protein